jgi:hypothetical protein
MKLCTFFGFVLFCSTFLASSGCTTKSDFCDFIKSEIGQLGGMTNRLPNHTLSKGNWSFRRDQFGIAIDINGISFSEITNYLTQAYGEPLFYTGGNALRGPIYLYPPTNAGIAIFVASTKNGVEVTLTKSVE